MRPGDSARAALPLLHFLSNTWPPLFQTTATLALPHRHPDPKPWNVEADFEGLERRFVTHAQSDKARALGALWRFLAAMDMGSDQEGLAHRILALLLHLSGKK